jgi:hypothetical protein
MGEMGDISKMRSGDFGSSNGETRGGTNGLPLLGISIGVEGLR